MSDATQRAETTIAEVQRDLSEIGDATFVGFISELHEAMALRRAMAAYSPGLQPLRERELVSLLAR
jgi:hypothetical protein